MSTSGEKIESVSAVRALLLTGTLGLLWGGLLAYLVFVVPKHERVFIDNRMAIPRVAEWVIEVSRWCVKYWYVVVVVLAAFCLGALVILLRLKAHWGIWAAWLLLAVIPLVGLMIAWQFVAELPIPFRLIPMAEKHFEVRSAALKASPEIEKEWRAQLANMGFKDIPLEDYLIFLDPLWDEDQRLRPEVSKVFCDRLAALDAATIADWQKEFAKAVGIPPSPAHVASLLILHERMFAKDGLNPEEMRLLKGRLRAVPKPAIEKWEHLALEGRVHNLPAMAFGFGTSAAMDLIRRDELFLRERWEQGAFQSLCDEAAARKSWRLTE